MKEGTKIILGGKELTVPPLNLKSIKKLTEGKHLERLSTMTSGVTTTEQIESVIAVITAAIQRNYPDITQDWIEENVELSDIGATLIAIMSASGFKGGEGKSPNVESP